MRVTTLKKDTALSALAAGCGISKKELMDINEIEIATVLPCGMSLVLPSKEEKAEQSIELFVSSTANEPDISPSASVHTVSTFQPGDSTAPCEALPVLAISNTDENGILSASRAHELFMDENASQKFAEELVFKLEDEGWGGLLVNMEYLFPFDRAAYTDFVRNLEKAVHRAGRWLMVSVPASAILRTHSRSAAAYDIEALAHISDRIILMPEEVWSGGSFENCLLQLSHRIPLGKVLAGIRPQGLIRRGEQTSHMEAAAAHNLALSAKARISRKSADSPAEFTFMDAAAQPCHVQYTDALWLFSLFRQIGDFGIAGIFCPELSRLCPGAKWIFRGLFRGETLI